MEHAALIVGIVLGVYTLFMILVKLSEFREARSQTISLVKKTFPAMEAYDIPRVLKITREYPRSHVAQVAAAGLSVLELELKSGTPLETAIKRADQEMIRKVGYVRERFNYGTLSYKFTGASSPILAAFFSTPVALVLGVVVVVPAVWMSIYTENHVKLLELTMTNNRSELITYLEKNGSKLKFDSA